MNSNSSSCESLNSLLISASNCFLPRGPGSTVILCSCPLSTTAITAVRHGVTFAGVIFFFQSGRLFPQKRHWDSSLRVECWHYFQMLSVHAAAPNGRENLLTLPVIKQKCKNIIHLAVTHLFPALCSCHLAIHFSCTKRGHAHGWIKGASLAVSRQIQQCSQSWQVLFVVVDCWSDNGWEATLSNASHRSLSPARRQAKPQTMLWPQFFEERGPLIWRKRENYFTNDSYLHWYVLFGISVRWLIQQRWKWTRAGVVLVQTSYPVPACIWCLKGELHARGIQLMAESLNLAANCSSGSTTLCVLGRLDQCQSKIVNSRGYGMTLVVSVCGMVAMLP